ncbi:hypothetical protein Dimus_000731 [Dionaea muscipula]
MLVCCAAAALMPFTSDFRLQRLRVQPFTPSHFSLQFHFHSLAPPGPPLASRLSALSPASRQPHDRQDRSCSSSSSAVLSSVYYLVLKMSTPQGSSSAPLIALNSPESDVASTQRTDATVDASLNANEDVDMEAPHDGKEHECEVVIGGKYRSEFWNHFL